LFLQISLTMAATGQSPTKKARTSTSATPETDAVRKVRLMTAVITPYKEDGNIDLDMFDRIVAHQISCGVEGLIIGGTTGEGHLMSWDEHLTLIAHAAARWKDKVLIVGNTGSNCTAEMAYATKKGFAAGMHASLLINPYYGKTSDEGIKRHILEGGLDMGPAIIYNVPGRTGQDIKPELIMQLSGHKHFAGVKECMGHERIAQLSKQGIVCWSGNDDQCYESRQVHGGHGVISVTATVVPSLMRRLMHGAKDAENDALNTKLAPLYKWLFAEPNPIGVKTMMIQLGMSKPCFRLPYVPCGKAAREEGKTILAGIGLEHCPAGEKGLQVLEDSDFKCVLNGDA
jgi:4-hydroxy-tetrahydrodipicolinate synthase